MSKEISEFKRPEDSPGFLLWQVSTIWQREINRCLEKYKLKHSAFVILALLYWCETHDKIPNQSFIIHQSKLDKMTVSNVLKKLVEQKLVERQTCHKDSRAKILALSKKGRVLIQQVQSDIESVDQKFFAKLDNKHVQQLVQNFMQLVEA